MVGPILALPHELFERAPLGLETYDPSIKPPSRRQLFHEASTITSKGNDTLIAEAVADFHGTSVPVPGTLTTVIIASLPETLDAHDIEQLLIVKIRAQIHAHSLPDKGNEPITPNFRVRENDKLVFSALSVPPQHTTWNILFETTIGLRIFMLDQGHHVGCDYVIEHEGVRVGMGSIRTPSMAISK
ncbi:MAG: hypothetical protein Q9214_000574 [Letrouitia sp. 1 TL-2023]